MPVRERDTEVDVMTRAVNRAEWLRLRRWAMSHGWSATTIVRALIAEFGESEPLRGAVNRRLVGDSNARAE